MIPKTLGKLGLKTAYGYIEKDPEHNLPKLMEWVDRLLETAPTVSLYSGTHSAQSSMTRTTICISCS